MALTPSRAQEDLSGDRLLSALPRDDQGRPVLGRIPLICRIGRGGMGAVYYAVHPRLAVEVAVKILPFTLLEQDPQLADRFHAEGQMAAALASEHIVRVLDVDHERDTHFIVMEYVDGETPGGLVKRLGRGLAETDALAIVRAATRGLALAHSKKIVHRDIKPDNILIPKEDGQLAFAKAKLADLGLAKPEGGGPGTQSHIAMGTPGYMAPEQIEDAKTAGPRADVFSMGATLYSILAGHAPFTGSTLGVILRDTAAKDPPPLPQGIGSATRALIARCLEKDPGRRFANGAELERELAEPSVAPSPHATTLVEAERVLPPDRRRAHDPVMNRMELTLDRGKRVKMEWVLIRSGAFVMGEGAEAHRVELTKDYWMQTTPVTQAQWKAIMGSNPASFKGVNRPVERVSWDDCQEFFEALNAKARKQLRGLAAGLPTEAEWEYACRAGTTTKWYGGDDDSRLGDMAWFSRNSGKKTHPVAQKRPNGWGLYDMHGNVMEWCQDWHGPHAGPSMDPTGPPSGTERCLRGGSWFYVAALARSGARYWDDPTERVLSYGLRSRLRIDGNR